jgi:hypothetical protein
MAPALKGRSVSRRTAVAILGSGVAASVLATTGEARGVRTPPPKACKKSSAGKQGLNLLCVSCCREAADVIIRGHGGLSNKPEEQEEKDHLQPVVKALTDTQATRLEHALMIFDLNDAELEIVQSAVRRALPNGK